MHIKERFILLVAVILQTTSSFSPSLKVLGVSRSQTQHWPLHPRAPLPSDICNRMSNENEFQDESEERDDMTQSPMPNQDPVPPPQVSRTPQSPPPRRLDPLLASLTRVDPQANANAPKKKLPLLGEVTMDQNLFIILPVVAFAILGFASFFLVAFNSQDAFIDAINEWNDSVLNPPAPEPISPDECRGLCSSQQEDLEGLRSFMEGISGKK